MRRRIHGWFRPGKLPSPEPDVGINFETGDGIPTANGGRGNAGADVVHITSPQSGAGFLRRRLRPAGYSLFEPKPADHLVGWAGPGAGSCWAGPIPAMSSASETIDTIAAQPDLSRAIVDGGVVGAQALRITVTTNQQSGSAYGCTPAPTMSSGWVVGGARTVAYCHAVLETLNYHNGWRPRVRLYDVGAAQDIDTVEQLLGGPDGIRSGSVHRGVGPHGGQVYELWAVVRCLTEPVGPISAIVNPLVHDNYAQMSDRTIILHGVQSYFLDLWYVTPIVGLPSWFSYARGSAVAWTAENMYLTGVGYPYSAAFDIIVPYHDIEPTGSINPILALNGQYNARWTSRGPNNLNAFEPDSDMYSFHNRAVVRVDASRNRAITVDGLAVLPFGRFDDLVASPSFVQINSPFGNIVRKVCWWNRALTGAEMLGAFRDL